MEKWVIGLTVLCIYFLMVLGNIVTTTGSGLACPDWPLCYGSVNPPKELAVWIEWGHRLTGALTGVLMITSAVFMWRNPNPAIRFLVKTALGLVLVAILLGGIIVLIEAPLLSSFLHVAVASSHIVVSTIIFTCMVMAFRTLSSDARASTERYALWLFGLVYFQVVLGVVVRYSEASLACPDFPLCQGQILPPDYSAEVLLQYFHRLTAFGIFVVTLWNLIKNINAKDNNVFSASVTFGLVILQASIGISIVLTLMFLPLLVLHGAVGFMLLGWTAYLCAPNLLRGVN